MKFPEFSLLLTGVLLNAGAQLLLKSAAQTAGPVVLESAHLKSFAWALAASPACWAAMLAYALSIGVWAAGLSRVPVSQAYPLLSIGYVIMLLAGWWLFGEAPTSMRVVGIGVIVVGVGLVAAS